MEPDLHRTATDYQRLADAHTLRGPAPQFTFTGSAFTNAKSRREHEVAGKGCGIVPRVWPPHEGCRMSEVPVTSRSAMSHATTALAAQSGITPRRKAPMPEPAVSALRMEGTVWHQHDHERSNSDRKELRPMRAAGLHTKRIDWLRKEPAGLRGGTNDRPEWIRENKAEPGSWHYTPSDKHGDPTLFGRNAHFTQKFTCQPQRAG